MAKPLKVHNIPFTEIQSALSSSSPFFPQRQFNTKTHALAEIEVALPHITHYAPDSVQPFELLTPWLDLICKSQHINSDTVHRIRLPRPYCNDLIDAGRVWQLQGRISSATLEDLEDGFPARTTSGRSASKLFADSQEYFVRLDTCSLKDARSLSEPEKTCGTGPVANPQQIWQRIVTSHRGCGGIADLLTTELDVYLFLFPWRPDVAVEGTEFRVFCPPPGDSVAAISQYHWHRPLKSPAGIDLTQNSELQRVRAAIECIHAQILASASCTKKLRQTGFTFDVLVLEEEVQLLELNPFGAMSGCGSCLFQWIRDTPLLYGLQKEVEVRVCCQ